MTTPALLAISHGTSSPAGQAAVAALVDAVARELPDVTVRLGHVDVQQPDVADALHALPADQPVIVVPLLLSAGYHVRSDLVQQSAGREGVVIAPPLGPDPRLVDALIARLGVVGPDSQDPLILAAAGSSDERANEDCRTVGRILGERLGRAVVVAFLAAAEPRLGAAVSAARADSDGRVVVADYLLAPGYFHDLAMTVSEGATVARPLLDDDDPHPGLVGIVIDRYSAAAHRATV